MAKIKLGQRPRNFKLPVKFKLLDGEDVSIECVFKYRSRKEFGQFLDDFFAAANEQPPADGKFSMADFMGKVGEKNAEYLSQVLEGWNLDEEFCLENLRRLADELPGAVSAIMESYREAVQEGRLGN